MTPLPAMVILVVLFFIPLMMTLAQAVFHDGRFTLSFLKDTFSSPYNLKIISFTFKQALVSTLFSMLIGLPGAYIISRFSFKGRKLLRAICTVPFVLPPILVVLGFVIFYGNSGFLNRILMSVFGLKTPPLRILYSFQAIIIAHSFYNFPVAMNIVSSSWEQLDESCEKAARTLGSGKVRTFLSVTLPRLAPSILSSATLIFLFCFTSFAVILVLGGGPQFTTMEVEIYNQAKRAMNINFAASLSLMSMTICLFVLGLNTLLQRKAASQARIGSPTAPGRKLGKAGAVLTAVYIILLLFFVLAPIISVLARSVISSSTRSGPKLISFEWYSRLFKGSTWQAVLNSITIGLASAFVSTILGLSLCIWIRRHNNSALEIIAMLPMAISTVIIGLGYYIISRYLSKSPDFLLIVLAHVVITIPFVIRSIAPVYRSLPQNIMNAAMTLGCSPARTFFSIELPLLRSSILTSLSFAFAISVGEMNATMMLSNNRLETIPTVIYRLINSYNFQGACALGSVLIVICFAIFLISESARKRSAYV